MPQLPADNLASLEVHVYGIRVIILHAATFPFTDFVDCQAKRRLLYSEASRVCHIA